MAGAVSEQGRDSVRITTPPPPKTGHQRNAAATVNDYAGWPTMDYQHVAETLVNRASELLQTAVAVTDDRDLIVAGSDARTVGLPSRLAGDALQPEYLRVPLRLDTRAGEVIIAQPRSGEALSPRLAQIILDLVVSNTVVVSQLPNQHVLKSKFLHDVLHGTVTDEATILREAKVLGLDLVPPRAVILIDAAD